MDAIAEEPIFCGLPSSPKLLCSLTLAGFSFVQRKVHVPSSTIDLITRLLSGSPVPYHRAGLISVSASFELLNIHFILTFYLLLAGIPPPIKLKASLETANVDPSANTFMTWGLVCLCKQANLKMP